MSFHDIEEIIFDRGGIASMQKSNTPQCKHGKGSVTDYYRIFALFATQPSDQSCMDCPGNTFALTTTIPFIRKRSCLPDDYETLYQEMVDAMQQPDYVASWTLMTAWGTKESNT